MHLVRRHAATITAGAFAVVTAIAVPAVAGNPTEDAPERGPDMAHMADQMMHDNMPVQMMDDNPGMARMHEQMTRGRPSIDEPDPGR